MRASLTRIAAAIAAALLALAACDDGADPHAPADVAATPLDWCELAPVVTWDNFGQGFLVENCQPCHASASQARHEAPEDVVFDTLADTTRLAERVLIVATGDDPEMPPAGGVSPEDRALLEVWLRCGLE
ncbi:MAG: hypothetical protein IT385_20335 [Deltaproteobacteria bacterium]|nr:hypothetical protein [Deltaproteobacteria bacterium]